MVSLALGSQEGEQRGDCGLRVLLHRCQMLRGRGNGHFEIHFEGLLVLQFRSVLRWVVSWALSTYLSVFVGMYSLGGNQQKTPRKFASRQISEKHKARSPSPPVPQSASAHVDRASVNGPICKPHLSCGFRHVGAKCVGPCPDVETRQHR